MSGLMLKHVERTHRGGTSQNPLSSWGALRTSCTGRKRREGQTADPDPGGMLHASVDASWRLTWARHSDMPILAMCIQLGLLVSLLNVFTGHHALARRAYMNLLGSAI